MQPTGTETCTCAPCQCTQAACTRATYRQHLRIFPNHAESKFWIAALSGDNSAAAPPPRCIASLFDQCECVSVQLERCCLTGTSLGAKAKAKMDWCLMYHVTPSIRVVTTPCVTNKQVLAVTWQVNYIKPVNNAPPQKAAHFHCMRNTLGLLKVCHCGAELCWSCAQECARTLQLLHPHELVYKRKEEDPKLSAPSLFVDSDYFDQHLVAQLEYQTPQLLM